MLRWEIGSMNKPLRPLVPEDLKRARPSVYLNRAACGHLRSFITGQTPVNAAKAMFGNDLATEYVIRTATAPAMTTTTGWAKELAGVAIYDMIQSITSISAGAELISRGLQLNLDGIAELRVPGRVLNAAAAGMWVAEGAPAPARQLSFSNAAILRPRKLSVIYSYTQEMVESSNIENIVRQTLGEAAGLALDVKMFSADPASASAPAGLFNGVAPQTATPGGGLGAMMGDLKLLFGALATAGGGKTAVIVAALPQATALKMTVGPQFDVPIIASTGLAAGTVAVVEAASFVSGFSSVPEFRVGRDASFHFDDSAPADPVMGGVPVKSMYQTDGVALRMDVFASWGLRASGHTQWLSGCTW
jgi:hypothetical protein